MKALQRSTRIVRPLVLALAVALAPAAAAGSAPPTEAASATTATAATAAACKAQWGSVVKRRAPYSSKRITNVRSGRRPCFDRLVVDVNARGAGRPGYQLRYVKRVTKDGSGANVPLRGGAKLMIIVNAPAYGPRGRPTYRPANRRELVDVDGYRTFRQVAWAGSFEGQTTIGLGVRARLPMRAFVTRDADGGHRVVIDVAHRWY